MRGEVVQPVHLVTFEHYCWYGVSFSSLKSVLRRMSDDEQYVPIQREETTAEMEERLEARLMERVMKKVNEQLASQQPATLKEKGQWAGHGSAGNADKGKVMWAGRLVGSTENAGRSAGWAQQVRRQSLCRSGASAGNAGYVSAGEAGWLRQVMLSAHGKLCDVGSAGYADAELAGNAQQRAGCRPGSSRAQIH